MNSDEVLKERLEFLKLEYQQLRTHIQHLENAEWRVCNDPKKLDTSRALLT